MAEYPTWRRRLAALGVLVLACAALVATTPAIIQSSLDASHSGSTDLTLEAPRVTGRVVLELSAAALPATGERGLRVSGTVGVSQRNPNAAVRMSVRAAGVDAAPSESDSSASWPIEQLCRVAEPCQREFEVTFEWLDPQPDTIQRGSFDATVRIDYNGVEKNPEGATAIWSDTVAFTPAPVGPLLSADTSPERLTLDRGQPIAVRHATLTATNIPQSARTAAFIDSSAADSGSPAVRFSLIPDDSGDGAGGTSDSAIDPFANCPETGECKRGVTILIQLAELDPDMAAAIEWSLRAQAEFPGATATPDGARLSAVVDQSTDVGPETPVIKTSASGTLEPGPDASGTVRSFTRIMVVADDAAFRLGGSGAMPPLAVGVLTIEAVGDATVDIHVAGSHGTIDAYPSLTLAPSQRSATVLVYPLRWCDGDAACTAEIDLSANKANPAMADTLPVATVEWNLDLQTFYPGLEEPPNGAQVRIDVHVDDR
ncbi:MAG TPA: hypothetical protein VK736_08345 [Candidatus Binatia bacterium]|nr:hypothetical protein [Candidatus Binatia bacterium]